MPTLDEAGCCPRAGADENRPSIDGSRFLSGAGTALAAPTASANIINPIPANCNLKSYITYFLFSQPMTSRPAVERFVSQHLGCHQIVAIGRSPADAQHVEPPPSAGSAQLSTSYWWWLIRRISKDVDASTPQVKFCSRRGAAHKGSRSKCSSTAEAREPAG